MEENNKIIVKSRSIIPQSLKGEISFLEIYPKVALTESDHFIQLSDVTPLQVLGLQVKICCWNGKDHY